MTADMPSTGPSQLAMLNAGSVQDMIRPGCTGRKQINVGRPAKAVLVVLRWSQGRLLAGPD